MKFGGSFRHVSDSTQLGFGNGWLDFQQDASGTTLAIAYRPYIQNTSANYGSFYAGDTLTFDRLTLNAALRYDRSTDSVLAASVPAQPDVPTVLPAVNAPAVHDAVVWNIVTPRVGATYALDTSRKTQLRASYSQFASQLNITTANAVSAAGYAYAYYLAVDANHNYNIEPNEIVKLLGVTGVDPNDPLKVVNQIDPHLKSPRTHEIVGGIDREIAGNIALSASYTWRRYNDVIWPLTGLPVAGVTSADYVPDGTISATLPDGRQVSATYYALPAASAPVGGGSITENRAGYHRSFNGVEVSATKRLSHHWMGRVGYSWNDEKEYFDNPATAIVDPTSLSSDPHIDGGLVTRATTGSGKSQIYLTAPTYQFIANGMYQARWGVNISGNLLVRQGFAEVFYAGNVATDDAVHAKKNVLVDPNIGDFRLPTLTSFDARFEKAFKINNVNAALDIDVFNLVNAGTVLGRQYDVQASNFNAITEIMNPRIVRFGVRFNF